MRFAEGLFCSSTGTQLKSPHPQGDVLLIDTEESTDGGVDVIFHADEHNATPVGGTEPRPQLL